MSRTAIIYKSIYGTTKKYAQWIAEEINGDLFEQSEVKIKDIMKYDKIIYGGGLYASGIAGASFIRKNYQELKNKRIIIFTVGLASTDDKAVFVPIIEKNFNKEIRDHLTFFHLRGGIDYAKLSVKHRAMMAMLKAVLSRKDVEKLTEDDKELLATYGEKVDFTDRSTLQPLITYIKNTQMI